MMKLKGVKLEGTYKVRYGTTSFVVHDEKDNRIYCEDSDDWVKWEYNKEGNMIYFENSDGFWSKRKYDKKGNEVYYENSDGFWSKSEYDEKRNKVYYEDSDGEIFDERVKELTVKEVEELLGYKIKIKRK
ncbi:hypothetical protein [Methanoculleus sp.]|uniref:hypothetical protein n=1 Tax=Methanoculleus sp. TaxID=90427 RepID=UPI0025F05B7C|nr:hypothetical protein [Methanoculleus sp.]MCK9320353.1 hypothetical protein [Methanoculleus sp.]